MTVSCHMKAVDCILSMIKENLRRKVEQVFAQNPRKLFNYKQLAARLEAEGTRERNELILVLKKLEKEQLIEELQPGRYVSKWVTSFVSGRVDMTQRGAAYVTPDTESDDKEITDIFVAKEHLNTALHGDKVKLQLLKVKGNGKPCGEVVEVLERNKTDFVGIIKINFNQAIVAADDRRMYAELHVPKEKTSGAKNGDKVIVRLTEWLPHDENPTAEVIEVLGRPGEHHTEINAIVAEFGFASKFPAEVEKEANSIPEKISKDELSSRRDFRKVLTFTIDPADAKDFDDAISFHKNNDGSFEIGVHIADVSHYVKPGSKLEEEACKRGTSVYLVDRTVPMLPERLSNGLCSLRPEEDKLTFSAVFTMNEEGRIKDEWFGKTIIHSSRRFTYEEALERIETGKGDLAQELATLNNIAKILREERFRQGAISFETQEVKFVLDEHFKPVDVYLKVRKDAHKLVEEFMLLANRKVAEYVNNMGKSGKKKTFVYRVHENPNEDKLKLFSVFAARFGYRINTQNLGSVAHSLNRFLQEVEGKPEQNVLQSQAIRTMAKAFYSVKKSGHYGLGFAHYTHFTSPIRRYPDLMAHRLLHDYMNHRKSVDENQYEEKCKYASAMEQKAADAERASVRYKQVEYMRDFIGETFNGIISGVTDWGMYVEMTQYKCEGLVRLNDIHDDYYEYDERNQWIIGRHTRKKYQLGDSLQVVVVAADILKRQIDLQLAGLVQNRPQRKQELRFEREKKSGRKGGNKNKRRR